MNQKLNHEENRPDYLHKLAKIFEPQIKETIAKKFSISADDLSILFDDNEGVYLSGKEDSTLCCLVVGQKDGLLYLVTAKITLENTRLDDFKSDILA